MTAEVTSTTNFTALLIAMLQLPKISLVEHAHPINGIPVDDSPTLPTDMFAIFPFSGTQYKVACVSFFGIM